MLDYILNRIEHYREHEAGVWWFLITLTLITLLPWYFWTFIGVLSYTLFRIVQAWHEYLYNPVYNSPNTRQND